MNAGWDPAQVRKARAEKAEAERCETAAILSKLSPKSARTLANAPLYLLRGVLAQEQAAKSRPAAAGPAVLGTPRAMAVPARSRLSASMAASEELDRRMGLRASVPAIVDKGGSLVFAATKPPSVGVVVLRRAKLAEPTELDRRMGLCHASGPTIVEDHGSRLVFSTMNTTRAIESAARKKTS